LTNIIDFSHFCQSTMNITYSEYLLFVNNCLIKNMKYTV